MTVSVEWILGAVDAEEAFRLTADLVRIRSYPGEEAAVQGWIVGWLAEQGLAAELVPVTEGRPNVVLRLTNGTGPTLLLNGHVDTVLADPAWAHDPWEGRREGDRLFGLGAGDMKCGVAAMLLATRALDRNREAWSGTVLMTSVVDEEAYSIGAHAVIDALAAAGERPDACVVLESAWERPCLGGQGKMLVRVDVRGKAAHASFPEQGVNAAVEAARLVAWLDELAADFPTHPHIRASQSVLSSLSGSAQYVITVPEAATVLINRHTVPGETEAGVLGQYRALAEALGSRATFAFSVDPPFYPPWETAADAPIARAFAAAYAEETGRAPEYGYVGFGDPNLFATEAGIPTVMFGAHAGRYHQAGEWVDVPSIAAAARTLLRMAVALLPAG